MTIASATMATIADIIGGVYLYYSWITWSCNIAADSKPYNSYYKMLSDNTMLDQLHWDPNNKVVSCGQTACVGGEGRIMWPGCDKL